ncbi:nucleotide sugar dehydrogenase [Facklamia miroungae]|uniref:UDP-N-acetyl-D-galactosamine dehydrogenase n=1 Tax=Facklamia miroungae TaxID=120956 RepID=A0A1G7TJA2_9LACT|nr:nucleotide sugar dehydrogenase [Facklamia miroungae]NKZ29817.1 nucleotide sugar dehydrogenase [Facklamia miroungae]SDG35281.1 UDP-N-acetyl-D-galactosamine dehydrogenase [Facklamia miroungae]
MNIYQNLLDGKTKLAVVGLGYVGMPIAIEFAKHVETIGYDNNVNKIEQYLQGVDPTLEVGDEAVKNTTLTFTYDQKKLQEANFIIVAVPTPINQDKTPNLDPVISATRTVGKNMSKGTLVAYESTVYPGVTEELCIAELEESSGLVHGVDFWVGYSPERINPGDKVHTLSKIRKIVSATTPEALETMAQVYELVIEAGVHRAPSIKVAEAAKVVENSQRDINIAFMNELALVFDRMEIDSQDVIDAMNTKWNALGFSPGLVGGHCIGVDPYYFVYEAENLGYHSQIILSGRQINDQMGEFIGDKLIKLMVKAGKKVTDAQIVILGLTFKEHTPDTRNSKVADIINYLRAFNIEPLVVDPWADPRDAKAEYDVDLTDLGQVQDADAVIFAVAHEEFKQLNNAKIESLFNPALPTKERVLMDVKSIVDATYFKEAGYTFWRL